MGKISFEDLVMLREKHKNEKIVFCSGSFDLFHVGHILFLEDCRKFGDILVVGVGGDEAIRESKGPNRPILNEHIRLKTIGSLNQVDYFLLDDNLLNKPHKLGFVESVLKTLKPDVYAVNEDGFQMNKRKEIAQNLGIQLKILQRHCPPEFENISTTKIIEKVKTHF